MENNPNPQTPQDSSFDINVQAGPNPTIETNPNPLNTGDGAAPTPEMAQSTPMAAPVETPVQASTEAPAVEMAVEEQVQPSLESEEMPEQAQVTPEEKPKMNLKKYLIIAGVVIVLLGAAYLLYANFIKTPDAIPTGQPPSLELNNSLSSEDTSAKQELEQVVEDIKDVYAEDTAVAAPPSLELNIEAESNTPDEFAEDSSKVTR